MNPDPSRAEALFLAAAAIPELRERAAFVDQECGGDVALRQRVEALLSSHDEAGTFLMPAAPSPAMDAGFARLNPEEAGERIGRYKLLQQIGEGGFGTVWMAEQEEPVRRRVALKVIKLGMDTKEIVDRFEQERQALAMMDHPNIAKVLDAGATPLGRPFFVMELVRGIKITDYCDEAKLSTAERLQLFIAVCQAVQHAHQKGIIHRDLKPSNILVTLLDGVPVPKVIDFGVAKAIQARLTDKTLFTQFEQMIGTPLYMSPEQAELSGLDIDTRSDIYSLGVLLYELLTGRTPVDAETLRRAGLDEIRRIIREQEPPRPSTALQTMARDAVTGAARHRGTDPPRLIGLLRGDLDWIVMKALEKDRTRRFETVNALAQDLRRYLAGDAVEAGSPSARYRLGKLAKRYRGALAATAVVLLSLLAGMGFTIWQAVRATRAEKLASRHLAMAQGARDAAEGLTTEAIIGLRKKLVALGRSEIMEDVVSAADAYYRKLPPELVTDESERHRASLLTNHALIAGALGREKEHEDSLRETIRILERLAEKDPENQALQDEAAFATLGICYLYWERSDHDSLFRAVSHLITRCEGWLKKQPRTAWAMRYQVVAHGLAGQALAQAKGKSLEAFLHFQAAAQTTKNFRSLFGETADVCECEGMMHYANALIPGVMKQQESKISEYEAAAGSFTRALELGGDAVLLRKMQFGAIHNAGGMILERGRATGNADDTKRGEALVRQASEGRSVMVEQGPGYAEYWRDLAFSHGTLSGLASDKKDGAAELQHQREALRCREEAVKHQPTSPRLIDDRAASCFLLAKCLHRQVPPDNGQAIALMLRGIEDWRRSREMTAYRQLFHSNLTIGDDIKSLVKLAAAGDAASAAQTLSRARAILEPLKGKLSDGAAMEGALAELLKVQGEILTSLGRTEEAAEVKAASDKFAAPKPAISR